MSSVDGSAGQAISIRQESYVLVSWCRAEYGLYTLPYGYNCANHSILNNDRCLVSYWFAQAEERNAVAMFLVEKGHPVIAFSISRPVWVLLDDDRERFVANVFEDNCLLMLLNGPANFWDLGSLE